MRIGKYDVVGTLGHGAHGEVLRATTAGAMGFRRQVAIKRVHPELMVGADPEDTLVRSLVNEARLAGLFHHANVVESYDFAQDDEGWYLVMEYVEGITFKDLIKGLRETGTRIPLPLALELMEQVCRGLHYLHELTDHDGRRLHLVHRDLKPANLMLAHDGVVKIMDFGIAKAVSNLGDRTLDGDIKGSPSYMAPEQARADGSHVGPAADTWAVGVILYELLTHERLFQGERALAVLHAVVSEDVEPKLAGLDESIPGISRILRRCLRRPPHERWESARDLGNELEAMLHSLPHVESLEDFAHRWTGGPSVTVPPKVAAPVAGPDPKGASGPAPAETGPDPADDDEAADRVVRRSMGCLALSVGGLVLLGILVAAVALLTGGGEGHGWG